MPDIVAILPEPPAIDREKRTVVLIRWRARADQPRMVTVLVVARDAKGRAVLSGTLRGAGLATRTAADASEALEHLGQAVPDLVVLDLAADAAAPDGLLLLGHLRARWGRVPVVAITPHADPATERDLGTDWGVRACISRGSLSSSQLVLRLKQIIRQQAAAAA